MRDMTRLEVSPGGTAGNIRDDDDDVQIISEQSVDSASGSVDGEDEEGDVGLGRHLRIAASKGRFTMGYRSDCEKCRARVPGHWAHPPAL